MIERPVHLVKAFRFRRGEVPAQAEIQSQFPGYFPIVLNPRREVVLGPELESVPVHRAGVRVTEQQRGDRHATGVTRCIRIVRCTPTEFVGEIRGEVEAIAIVPLWIVPLAEVNIHSRADGVSAFDIGQCRKKIESMPVAGVAEPTRTQLDKVLRVGKAV